MINLLKSVDSYYHQKYPDHIILYRIRDCYTAFMKDAQQLAILCKTPLKFTEEEIPTFTIPSQDYLDLSCFVSHFGLKVKAIMYRNDAGEYDIPDIERLKMEEDMDY